MKHIPYEPPMKRVPIGLIRHLVERVLDQPKPTRGLQAALQLVLTQGEHKDRLR